jgi:hypothetical protein
MSASAGRFPHLFILAAALALGGCTTTGKPASELPAAMQSAAKPDDKPGDNKPDSKPDARKPAPAEAQSDPGPPLERHEAAGQCWMIADKRGGSMDAKIKMVDKCIDDRMKADAVRRGGAAGR